LLERVRYLGGIVANAANDTETGHNDATHILPFLL